MHLKCTYNILIIVAFSQPRTTKRILFSVKYGIWKECAHLYNSMVKEGNI